MTTDATSDNKAQEPGIAVAPGLQQTLAANAMNKAPAAMDRRNLWICLLAIAIGFASSLIAKRSL